MEEYIYIILGVLWLAASIYRASKKKSTQASKQKPKPVSSSQDKPVSSVKSLLEQLLDGQQLKVPEPEVTEIEEEFAEPMLAEVEERREKQSFQTKYSGYGFNSLESLSGEGISSMGHITFVDQMKSPEKEVRGQGRVDLRKAIIYKAILETPYI